MMRSLRRNTYVTIVINLEIVLVRREQETSHISATALRSSQGCVVYCTLLFVLSCIGSLSLLACRTREMLTGQREEGDPKSVVATVNNTRLFA